MVKCPFCAKGFEYYSSQYRPFCGEQCKLLDLGNWFDETYHIPAKEVSLYNEGQLENYDDEEGSRH